jgi:hypothetical protein
MTAMIQNIKTRIQKPVTEDNSFAARMEKLVFERRAPVASKRPLFA